MSRIELEVEWEPPSRLAVSVLSLAKRSEKCLTVQYTAIHVIIHFDLCDATDQRMLSPD
jgi:hypothetical protein